MELRVRPGLFKVSLPKARAQTVPCQALRTDTALKWPSRLSIIRGNFTFINHCEATPYWASRWVPAQKPIYPRSHHLRTTTIGHGTAWARVTKKVWAARLLLCQWFKMWFSAMGRKMTSRSSLCSRPAPQFWHDHIILRRQSCGAGWWAPPMQGIKLASFELEMSLDNGNTRMYFS